METAQLIKEIVFISLGVAGIALVIFLIVLVANLIKSVKSTGQILEDAEVVSGIAAERAKDVDDLIDTVSESVGSIIGSVKDGQKKASTFSAIVTGALNLFSYFTAKNNEADKAAEAEQAPKPKKKNKQKKKQNQTQQNNKQNNKQNSNKKSKPNNNSSS